jgi:tetrahydromethanopterin S-methyltransferase subunit B
MMSRSEPVNALTGEWYNGNLEKAGGGVPGYQLLSPPSGATIEEKIFVDQEKIMDDLNSLSKKIDALVSSLKPQSKQEDLATKGNLTITAIGLAVTAVGVGIAAVALVLGSTRSAHEDIKSTMTEQSNSNLKVVEAKLETTDARIYGLEQRFDGLDDHLSRVDSRIDIVQGQVTENGNGINRIEGHLNGIALLIQKDRSNR